MTNDAKRGGFTYVEVLVASLISVFLFIAAFEGLTFCKKAALSTACLSAAESFAFDEVNRYFNKPLDWFKDHGSYNVSSNVPRDLITAYFPSPVDRDVTCITTVTPETRDKWIGWLITVDMEWKVPGVPGLITRWDGGEWHRLPAPLTVRRSAFLRWDGRFEKHY